MKSWGTEETWCGNTLEHGVDWVLDSEDLALLYKHQVGIPDMPTALRLAREVERLETELAQAKRDAELAEEHAHYALVASMMECGL